MKKEFFIRLVILFIGIGSLLLCIGCHLSLEGNGENYTEVYTIYKDLSALNTIEEVEEYLVSNNYSYKIKKSTLILDDYKDIKYVINKDNSSGSLVANEKCVTLAKLDEKDYEIVTIEKTVTDEGEWIERIYFNYLGDIYSKEGNNYYINFTFKYDSIGLISCIVSVCALTYSIGSFLADLYNFIKRRNKQQQE